MLGAFASAALPVGALQLPLAVYLPNYYASHIGLSLAALVVFNVPGTEGLFSPWLSVALVPIALYLTGLLRILWDFVVAVVGWAGRIVFSPAVWLGAGLLGLCIVLWVVGGIVARRSTAKALATSGSPKAAPGRAVSGRATRTGTAPAKASAPPLDDDMAEIEALLKKRGIE